MTRLTASLAGAEFKLALASADTRCCTAMRHLTAIPRLATWFAAIAATFAAAPAVAHARVSRPSKARHHRRSPSRPALINPNDPSTWPAGFNPNDPSTYPPITHTATPSELRRLLAPNPAHHYASMNSLLDPAFPCRGARQLRPIFIAAAQSFQLRWQILAGIAEIETRDGCDLTTSSAGAVGWTQF